MHIVGVPVKENCKTGLSRQVGKTSIFTKESLVVIQDKMRERCINEFNVAKGSEDTLNKNKKVKIEILQHMKENSLMKELKDLNKKYLILKMKYLI